MKKIEHIIENCKECRHCLRYRHTKRWGGTAFCCDRTESLRLIVVDKSPARIDIPAWCPLETYKEMASTSSATPQTVILPGLPNLEWMTENLSGFGGTEVDGRWYYTYEEAEEAVKQLGNGWRIPKPEEWQAVDRLGSEWQEDGPHGLPGRLFGGDLFIEAMGYHDRTGTGVLSAVGRHGYYWASSPNSSTSVRAGSLWFHLSCVEPLDANRRSYGFPVRCVRNIK